MEEENALDKERRILRRAVRNEEQKRHVDLEKESDKETLRKRRKWMRMARRRIGLVTCIAEYQSFLIVC